MSELNLNKQQKEAVLNIYGATRIVAGPGTGKTRTVVEKIKNIVNQGYDSNKILAITFTNKAANEMRDRLNSEINNSNNVNFFTFHSFCVNVIRFFSTEANIDSNYQIIDTSDQKRIIKPLYEKFDINSNNYSYYDTLKYIENKKYNRKVDTSQLNKTELKILKTIDKIYSEYSAYQSNNNLLDFNDLIIKALNLLKNSNKAREYWQNRFEFILVDEFQDIDKEQYEIIKIISKNIKGITVVGDPDQTIYSWRGAKYKYMLDFGNDFKNLKTINLIENYRSNQGILNAANELIKNNKNRLEKDLIAHSLESYDKPEGIEFNSNSFDEVKFVYSKIQQLIRNKGYKYSDFAILYRNNYLSNKYENEFIQKQIPYIMIGSFKFWDRIEVKQTIAYINWLVNHNNFSFESICNFPSRKFGDKSLAALQTKLNINTNYFKLLNSESLIKLENFKNITNQFYSSFNSLNKKNFSKVMEEYLKKFEFLQAYEHDETKSSNIKELLSNIQKFISDSKKDNINDIINDFINYVSLQSSIDTSENSNAVKLMTIHASKGREFPIVFITGLNEKSLPSAHSIDSGIKSIEEERRLFYVAMTRAKNYLFVLWSRGLNYGKEEIIRSRFVNEIKNFIEIKYEDISNKKILADAKRFNFTPVTNEIITEGDKVIHQDWGEGLVLMDNGNTLEIAFNHKIGIRIIMKGHKSLKLLKN